jgi:hypothetical protein
LKLGVAERHHLKYLDDAENFSALKSLANQFFAADMAIAFSSLAVDADASTGEVNRGAPASPGEPRSEMVKEALRIFGGSVRNVRKETV